MTPRARWIARSVVDALAMAMISGAVVAWPGAALQVACVIALTVCFAGLV